MEHIGYAANRVLAKARKAAIARENDAGAELRETALSKVIEGKAPLTRRSGAPATADEQSGQAFAPKRSRQQRRSAGL